MPAEVKKLFLVLLLFSLFSCDVSKRHYRNGYYISSAGSKKSVNEKNSAERQKEDPKLTQKETITSVKEQSETTIASSNSESRYLIKQGPVLLLTDTCGDEFLYKDGSTLKVKVIEIEEKFIRYKRCDNFDGPVYHVGKEKIEYVTYANGTKEFIEPPPIEKEKKDPFPKKKYFPDAIMWASITPFVLSGIGILISLYFAFKARRQILENTEVYKGYDLARFIILFDITMIAIATALMLAFLNIITFTTFFVFALLAVVVLIAGGIKILM